jgi:hypothetical protein
MRNTSIGLFFGDSETLSQYASRAGSYETTFKPAAYCSGSVGAVVIYKKNINWTKLKGLGLLGSANDRPKSG